MTRVLLAALLAIATCTGAAQPSATPAASTAPPSPGVTPQASGTPAASAAAPFLSMALTDVRTGETFRLGDFRGKVTLVQAMAVW